MTPVGVIRLVIIEDDELVRTGFSAILDAEPSLQVVGEAADGAKGLALIADTQPDVVLMDARMPVVDGVQATETLMTQPDPPQIIMLTTFEHDAYVMDALRNGARCYFLKRAPSPELVKAIHDVATSDTVLFPDSLRHLAANLVTKPSETQWITELPEDAVSVLDALTAGLSRAEIIQSLDLSAETVDATITKLQHAADARNPTALAMKALTER